MRCHAAFRCLRQGKGGFPGRTQPKVERAPCHRRYTYAYHAKQQASVHCIHPHGLGWSCAQSVEATCMSASLRGLAQRLHAAARGHVPWARFGVTLVGPDLRPFEDRDTRAGVAHCESRGWASACRRRARRACCLQARRHRRRCWKRRNHTCAAVGARLRTCQGSPKGSARVQRPLRPWLLGARGPRCGERGARSRPHVKHPCAGAHARHYAHR